tara:strand:+ start:1685 stop:2770 length:1086 start_codon:yes stop_codon:yes gene_type:complete
MSQVVVEEKKKRGRKKQNVVLQVGSTVQPGSVVNDSSSPVQLDDAKPLPKKRGRKPKGGKIIPQVNTSTISMNPDPNIILHLKCSIKDISTSFQETYQYDPTVESIQSFNFDENNAVNYLEEQGKSDDLLNNQSSALSCIMNDELPQHHNNQCNPSEQSNNINTYNESNDNDDLKLLWKKINSLKVKLHNNDISDKRSACFWCTCEFDNPPIYIPKCEFKETYQVYGCFCSPQCGTAYLMDEKMDSSVKFERYQLLNHVYGKIFNYEKNIKPAANPYYTLDKFYGNLSIKEYRELSKGDQLLILAEKPLTHVFPELYEDNSDYALNQRTTPATSYKLKRKTVTATKTTVLDNFGIGKGDSK